MKIKFTPGHGLAIHIDGQLAGVITKPGASISPDESGYYDCYEQLKSILSTELGWFDLNATTLYEVPLNHSKFYCTVYGVGDDSADLTLTTTPLY